MRPAAREIGKGIEFSLVVWIGSGGRWRACVVDPDATRRHFASPFELARYLAWPASARDSVKPGLR